jgi:hypothetical protein
VSVGGRRVAASLTALALGLFLLGSCPCASAGPDGATPAPGRASATPAPCCPDAAPPAGLLRTCCCVGQSAVDITLVMPTLGTPGPVSIVAVGSAPWVASLTASLPADPMQQQPPRRSGRLVLRI